MNFYVDLFTTNFSRNLIWIAPITTLIHCTYIFPEKNKRYKLKYTRDYNNKFIDELYNTVINYLKDYGNIQYVNSINDINNIMNKDNNYLFHVGSSENYTKYNNRFIFLNHGFDLRWITDNEIINITKTLEKRKYIYLNKKIYNTINNEKTKEIAKIIDCNKYDNINKKILTILGDSIDSKLSFLKFLTINLEKLIKLSEEYQIVIRPHPTCGGKNIYNKLKNLNDNFIIDTNISFITLLDKSDIIISYTLTSLIDNYALWKNIYIILIYNDYSWYHNNHRNLRNTNKILNNHCCVIQNEKNIDIIKGIHDALNMNKENMMKHRLQYLNNYFNIDIKNGNELLLNDILNFKNINNNKYWDNFYIKNNNYNLNNPSDFCNYIYEKYVSYLNNKNIYLNIVDLGAGNCRDSIFFANKNNYVLAIDSSGVKYKINNCKIITNDVEEEIKNEIYTNNFNIVYMRWFLHALPHDKGERIFKECVRILKDDGLICIEVRSINDTLLKKNSLYNIEDNSYFDNHKRWLYSKEILFKLAIDNNLEILEFNEDSNYSSIDNNNKYISNPLLIRFIIKKIV